MKVIHLLRKPLSEGTVASNTLKHGVGGLNINASRIAAEGETISNHSRGSESAKSKGKYGDSKAQETHQTEGQKLGRWPANVILQHLDGCRCVGTRKVKGHQGYPDGPGGKSDPMHGWGGKRSTEVRPNAWTSPATDSEGKETIAMWECAEGCPAARLDEQSGVSKSAPVGVTFTNTPARSWKNTSTEGIRRVEHGDGGGASRFFKQIGGSKEGD